MRKKKILIIGAHDMGTTTLAQSIAKDKAMKITANIVPELERPISVRDLENSHPFSKFMR